MTPLDALVLGIVQGLTEFLPVSSSGHLIIVPWLFGWAAFEGHASVAKALDVALHIGTLVAALVDFRHDIVRHVGAARPPLTRRARPLHAAPPHRHNRTPRRRVRAHARARNGAPA